MNAVIGSLTRFGLAGRHTYILTVRGRKTGRAYSTPVRLIEDGERWLVAPYGEVGWVRNARAAGKVDIRRAGRSETLRIEEIPSDQSAPVLQQYLKRVTAVRPFFDVTPDSPLEDFVSEASRHPPLPAKRPLRRAVGMATNRRHAQPPQAPQPPDRHRNSLKGPQPTIAASRSHRADQKALQLDGTESLYPTATAQSSTAVRVSRLCC
jgi:deazaflavin-dependent oxidoreductase (nitroreductase family)